MLADVWTVFWRDWIVLKRRLGRFIFARMVTPVLYLVAFGWGLGRGISLNQGGTNYLDFIVPGIIVLNSMTISFNAVGTPLNMSRLYHKTLEEYLIAPIGAVSFVIGKVLAGVLRGLISSVIIIVLAYVFGAKFTVNMWFLFILFLNCVIFSSLGLVAAMLMNSHEEMANFNTYVLTPMSLLCATFFTLDHLPGLLRGLIEILPLTHASYALRTIAFGGDIPWISTTVMLLYAVILFAVGIRMMRKARD